MQNVIAVLDIGKTNVKLCALDIRSGALLAVRKKNNTVLNQGDYPQLDIEGIWQWYCEQLKHLSSHYLISQLTFTTHGATAVCLDEKDIAFAVPDYEANQCEMLNEQYQSVRPHFTETYSPALKGGLNLARQLFWLSKTYPEKFSTLQSILMYPQFWAWKMSGVKASEVTSLGCHTDLWAPASNDYSSLVDRMSWRALFPVMRPAGAVLGTIKPELAASLGLSDQCQVLNGLHDSNASLVPYLQNLEGAFTVVSTGTWVVIAAIGADLENLNERDDMLANINIYGEAVPCIRFMGGREWELLRGDESCSFDDLTSVISLSTMLLPSFSDQGGPFADRSGKAIGPLHQLNGPQHTALASLYCALVSDYCLTLINSQGPLYIEGSFAKNEIYLSVLQLLRNQPVIISEDSTGTTQGAALVSSQCKWPANIATQPVKHTPQKQIDKAALLHYKQQWLNALSAS